MVFSSMIFLWIFLPVTFFIYRILDIRYKNTFLLIVSLLFYAWGEPKYILLMLISIFFNYLCGVALTAVSSVSAKRLVVAGCVAGNLGMLGYYKYFNFLSGIVNGVFHQTAIPLREIVLPIGISFYTFQALSYVVDLYRGQVSVQKNPLRLALYVSFFPQLIAGPIVKYHDIENQITDRTLSNEQTVQGIRRFIYGLGKKVIIANTVATAVDAIWGLPDVQRTSLLAWAGMVLYTLQIYYDFSGYSDMAIGLGKMFGFEFLENFNYPYISTSVQDFWRRWHISMSTWFKEYLYIPLGGNRKGNFATYRNLCIVFFATGLWHGASFNFVIWGLYHGFFLILERAFLGNLLGKFPFQWLSRVYTMLVVMFGWVLFRAETLGAAWRYVKTMVLPVQQMAYSFSELVSPKVLIIALAGILLCGYVQKPFSLLRERMKNERFVFITEYCFCFSILAYVIVLLSSGTYNPFIYFRF